MIIDGIYKCTCTCTHVTTCSDICTCTTVQVCTVQLLIKDPPRKGQPLYKGHFKFQISPKVYMQYMSTSEKRTAFPTRDKLAGPKVSFTQRFHCIHIVEL